MSAQLLFDFIDAVVPGPASFETYESIAENHRMDWNGVRCGTCSSMDTSLPGCIPKEIGRCVDPDGRTYYLRPENTRPNEGLPEGDPAKYPTGGSWAYVARDSCACDKHRTRTRASA